MPGEACVIAEEDVVPLMLPADTAIASQRWMCRSQRSPHRAPSVCDLLLDLFFVCPGRPQEPPLQELFTADTPRGR